MTATAGGETARRRLYVAMLVVLGLGWGSTQPLGKMATMTGHQPFGLIFWQLVICVVVLGGLSAVRGKGLVVNRATLRFYVIVAVLGTLVPNATFYLSAAQLPAGIMSIIISAVPMLAFPMALALGMERFSPKRLVGLVLGLAAVGLIAAPGAVLPDPKLALLLPVALIGPLFYAIEATYVARNGTAGLDAVQAMFGASVVGLVICAPVTLLSGQFINPLDGFGQAEAALCASSVIHALMYAGYVWLASQAGSVFAAQCSYIVTGAGIFWAMALLGERFPPFIWLAVALLLAGVALVTPRAAGAARSG